MSVSGGTRSGNHQQGWQDSRRAGHRTQACKYCQSAEFTETGKLLSEIFCLLFILRYLLSVITKILKILSINILNLQKRTNILLNNDYRFSRLKGFNRIRCATMSMSPLWSRGNKSLLILNRHLKI